MKPALTQRGCAVDKPAKAHAANLNTIIRAARDGALALMECKLNATGEIVAVLCAVNREVDEFAFTPFAVLPNGNPYELLSPPLPDGGFAS
jgi:hypothetical protein